MGQGVVVIETSSSKLGMFEEALKPGSLPFRYRDRQPHLPSCAASASLSLFPSGAVRYLDKKFQGSRLLLIRVFEDVDENCDSERVVNTRKEGRRLAYASLRCS